MRELQQNRKLLRPYWDIADDEAEKEDFSDKYEFFMKQSEDNRDRLRAGAVPAAGWTLDDWTKIGIVEANIAKAKEDFRKDPENIVVEAGLWKWGYINSPLNDLLMLMIVTEIA